MRPTSIRRPLYPALASTVPILNHFVIQTIQCWRRDIEITLERPFYTTTYADRIEITTFYK
jgi:hypothetical protein